MTLAKFNTKKGSPNNRRNQKRDLKLEFKELEKIESMMDSSLKSIYLDNLSFLKDEIRGNEVI